MRTLRFALFLAFACCGTISHAEPVKLFSYNIKHGQGMDGKLDLNRSAEVIAQHAPHLVALQEIDHTCTRSGQVNQAAALGKLLGMHHAFGMFMDLQGGEYGLAVLSKYPILKMVRHPLPPGAEPRCALEVIVQPEDLDTPLSFICVHNDWTDHQLRAPQVNALLKATADRKHPVVLAGDFNGERTDPSLKPFAQAPWTIVDKNGAKTFPADNPRKDIDYFIVRGWPGTLSTCTVIDERVASDHRPLQMVLEPK